MSLLNKRQSIQTPKTVLDIANENSRISDDFYTNSSYCINSTSEFKSTNNDNISPLIINEIGELLIKEFIKETKNDANITEFWAKIHNKIKENKDLINLVGQLKYLKIDLINTKIKCFSFWLNCFNYLILFAIFYRKWDINGEKKWKQF